MSYNKTNWQTGDVINAEKLNKLEQGVYDAQQSGGSGGGSGDGTLYVDFVVDTSGETPSVTTEAVFADVAAAVAAGSTVTAKVLLGQGMPVLYFPLSFKTPAGAPTAFGFSGIMDLSGPGEAAKPTLYSITFTANGCMLRMVDLAIPNSETETDG